MMASGALIERIGDPLTISASASVGLLVMVLIGLRWRSSLVATRTTRERRAIRPPARVTIDPG
jgi:hypothetical protein